VTVRHRPEVALYAATHPAARSDRDRRRHPRDTYLGSSSTRSAARSSTTPGRTSAAGSDHHDEHRGSLQQAGRHLGDAKDADADCLVTPCPLCQPEPGLRSRSPTRRSSRAGHAGAATCRNCRPLRSGSRSGARPSAPRREPTIGDRLDHDGRRVRPVTAHALERASPRSSGPEGVASA